MQTHPVELDAQLLRQDFPILSQSMHGQPLTYLDSAATSQKPRHVIDAIAHYYETSNANVHRSVYELAERATAAYEASRGSVAAFIGAEAEETIFVRNATEAINLVAYTWGRANLRAGDIVTVTRLEHHSNLVPWQILAQETGAELRFIELDRSGALDLESLAQHLATGRVRLVATAWVSNVLGTIAPVMDMARLVHAADALLLLDAAQAVPHMPVDIRSLGADFVAFTGHKMLGPMGIGILWGRRRILETMPPFLGGGEMIRRVSALESTWNDLPWKFEAGTPNVEGAVGLAAAVDYLNGIDMDAVQQHDMHLAEYAMTSLRQIPGITVYGPEARGAVVAFNLEGIHPHDLASLLDEHGIAVRAGHHCAQPLHDFLGVPATTRASFYVYNDEHDIEVLIDGIERSRKVLGV